jgi:MFS family permease
MTSTEHSPAATRFTNSYRALVTVLLMLAYTLNSADRQLVAIIGQPIKVDLGLSDTQLGLLVGTAFAALYAVSGLIIARMAERLNRVTIIAIALTVWSALTMLYGAAANFSQLLLTRMGVGVGEAGCTPAAHSLLSDYFEPSRRTTALSVYSCGIAVGYVLSAIVGGYVTLHYGWRTACMVLGLPGIAMAVAITRLIREPPRGNTEPRATERERPAPIVNRQSSRPRFWSGELAELGAVARTLLATWPAGNVVIGIIVSTFAAYGSWAFVPAFFKRAYPLDYGTIGLAVGLAGGVPVGIGLVAGGAVSDFIGARRARWYALIPALGLAISTPIYVLAFLQSEWQSAALLLAVAGFFQYVSFGPTFGIAQNVVEPHRRATATALIYVLLNVIALAFGPLFTGWLIDRLAEVNFVQAGTATWLGSLRAAWHVASSDRSFQTMCPGGSPIAAASVAVAAKCASALAQASRQGIIVTVLIYAWAALHYLLGSIGLERMLREAAARNAALAART